MSRNSSTRPSRDQRDAEGFASARRTASLRVVVAAVLAVGLSACDMTLGAAGYKVREDRRFAITGASQVNLSTFDGSVQLTARQGSATESDWIVTTGDGSIRAELPRGFNAEVDAESGDGRVSVEGLTPETGAHAGADDRGSRRERRRSARGTLGGGGRLLKLRTGEGSIDVQAW